MRKASIAVTSSKRATQFSPTRQRLLLALLAFSSLTSGGAAFAGGGALPTGGHFVGGQGAITQGGNHLTVNQSTQLGIINWQSFSIGKGNSVAINNGRGATLNRVTGADMSTIAGSLKSTGSVYIVNQAGVLVGPSGKITTNGSFVASTRDVSDSAFTAGGKMVFSGNSSGTVDNQGTITSSNGDVVLVGKSVSNSGAISAAKGSATLAAGDKVLLQASGDDTVLVETGSGDVTNTGAVQAAQVALNAKGGNVYALAVNDGGVIRATGTATKDGRVYLTAGDDVTVNAATVTATNANGSGGTVEVTGQNIRIGAKTRISADGTGKAAGGTVLIGGDRHGGAVRSDALSKQAVANAQTTTVGATATISADGGGRGNGGNVVIWSNETTNFAGHISAKGGANGGNGGQVEVSSEGKLGFTGRVSTLARHGTTGMLLLDPQDVVIYSSTDSNFLAGNFTDPSTSYMLNTTIDTALATSNVTISTSGGSGGNGDIHFGTNSGTPFTNAAPLYWSSAFKLTLQADNLIDTPGGNPNATTGGANPTNPGILVNSLGSGAITFTAAGSSLSTGGTAITITGDIAASGGAINLLSTAAGQQIVVGNGTTISNTAANGAGKIVFQADQVRLGTGSGPAGIVSTPGEVDIVPTSAGAVVLGDIDAAGNFFNVDNTTLLTAEDVFRISTSLLVIGSAQTTSISLTTANVAGENSLGTNIFDAAHANALKFLTGTSGTVTQDANTPIIVFDPTESFASGTGGLAVQTGGAITLNNTGNSVGSIAFKQTGTGGKIAFADGASTDGNLVVGTVGDISGIATVGTRTVSLDVSGDTVTQSTGAANAIAPSSGTIALELTGTSSSFTLDNPANTVKTVAANVQDLTFYDNVDLATGTAGSTTGVTATGDVAIVDNGQLTIGSGAGIATTGGDIRVEDQTFVNSDAGSAFSASGTWRVYSQDPTQDSANTAALSYSFVQYGATNSYADPFTTANSKLDSHASGNGFLFTVSPTASVTLSGTFNKTYDGTNAVTQTIGNSVYGTPTGLINGDHATFVSLSDSGATYSTKNAGANLTITLSQTADFASFKDSNNVTVYGYGTSVTPSIKGTISPLDVTVSGTRTYDGTTGAAGAILTVSGEIGGDPTLTVTGSGSVTNKNVGTSKNISSLRTLALSGTGAGNYHIASGTLTITPLDITISGTRTYDGTATAAGSDLSVVGEISGDGTLTVTGTGSVANKNVGTSKNIADVSGYGLTGTNAGNYNIASGTLTITPLGLTVSGTRTYDGTTTADSSILTLSGQIMGDPALTVTGSGTVGTKNVGTSKALTDVSGLGLTGTGAGNYTIASGTLTITPLDVTVSGTRSYDGSTTALGSILTVSGEIGGDPALTVTGSGSVTNKNVGTSKNISSLGTLALSGTGAGNYHIASGTLTITPLDVTVSGTRTYDGTTSADSSILTVVGEILGDPTLTVTGSGTVTNKNAGTSKNISNLGTLALSGTGASNYNLASGTLTITPLDVTVSGTRTYDGTTGASGTILTVSGEIGGDPALTVTGSGSVGNKNVGTSKNISSLGTLALSGTGAGNYNIASGTLTITPLDVTVTGTRTYDGTTGASGTILTVSGEIGGDPALTVTGSGSVANKNAGTSKNITNLGTLALSGTGAGNYNIASGTLTITPLDVTVTGTRTYDGSTTASGTILTVSGEIGGDPALTVTGSGNVANKNAGTSKNISSLGTLALSGTGAGNYHIASGTLTITPEDVTVSGTRAYDGTTTAPGNILTVAGEIGGDPALTVTGSGNVADPNAGTSKNITNLGTLGLSGTGSGNYHIVSGTLTITPADVTIVGFNGTRVYDGMTDADSAILALTGIVNGDRVGITGTGVLASKNVGKETVTGIGTLALTGADKGNYQIVVGRPDTYVIVTPATLTISAVTQTKVFDGTTSSNKTPTVVGLQVGDSVSGSPLTQIYGSKDVLGTNKSTLSVNNFTGVNDGNGGNNYNVVIKTAKGTITPENIVISAVTDTKVYDGNKISTGTPTLSDGTLYNGDTLTGLSQAFNSKDVLGTNGSTLTVDAGYTLTHAGNYTVTLKTAKGTITPLAIDATGTRVYDSTTDVDGGILKITNLIDGDTVGLSGTGTSSSPHVGTHDITGGNLTLTGGDAGNYTLVGGHETVKITPFAVVLFGTRVYDGETDGDSAILAVTNAFKGDDVTVTSGTSTIVSKNVGLEKIVDFGTLTLGGDSVGDYTLVGAKGAVKVTPELITVTAVPGTKTYDGTETSDGKPIVIDGTIFKGDTGDFIQTYGSKHAGTQTLTPSGSVDDGNGGNNYIVTYVPISDGIINPRPVDLYGTRPFNNGTDANSTILTITNLVPGDIVAVGGSTGTTILPDVGNEKIVDFTGLTLGGASSGDYTLVGATGIVNITPATPPSNPNNQVDNQTASGHGTQFDIASSGIINLQPQQNGVVTGTIATIDGTDYHPDSQLGCTLGAAGCIQNGVAPTTTSAPQ